MRRRRVTYIPNRPSGEPLMRTPGTSGNLLWEGLTRALRICQPAGTITKSLTLASAKTASRFFDTSFPCSPSSVESWTAAQDYVTKSHGMGQGHEAPPLSRYLGAIACGAPDIVLNQQLEAVEPPKPVHERLGPSPAISDSLSSVRILGGS